MFINIVNLENNIIFANHKDKTVFRVTFLFYTL